LFLQTFGSFVRIHGRTDIHLFYHSLVPIPVEVVVATLKNGKDKKAKEIYLVDAQSVTEAESRVVKDFEDSGVQIDYKVSGAKESRVLRVIE
jgi:hypothetical protein